MIDPQNTTSDGSQTLRPVLICHDTHVERRELTQLEWEAVTGPRQPGARRSLDPLWRPSQPIILDDSAEAWEIANRWVEKATERRAAALRKRLG